MVSLACKRESSRGSEQIVYLCALEQAFLLRLVGHKYLILVRPFTVALL